MPLAVLGIGANLGDRENNIAAALDALEQSPGISLQRLSCLYETAPVEVQSEQPPYVNACLLLETSLSPEELLTRCLEIEKQLGRRRTEYHGARTMDLDLLLYQGCQCADPHLILPHPRLLHRGFVLIPLADLFPEHQALGLDFSRALEQVDVSEVKRYL